MKQLEGWFAELDEEAEPPFIWRPTLQEGGGCLPLPVWFPSEADCEQYIRVSILNQGMLD